jgi:hypothetical protein
MDFSTDSPNSSNNFFLIILLYSCPFTINTGKDIIMAISATVPLVVQTPAQVEITYDTWYVTSIMIESTPALTNALVNMRRCRYIGDDIELAPLSTAVTFAVADLYAEAESDAALATALPNVLAAVASMGTSRNLL